MRIGCPEWITAGLLPVIIDELVKQHPRLTFHVQNTIPATSEFRELRQRTIDLVLGRIAHPFEEGDLQAEVLYQERLSVVAGTNSPLSVNAGFCCHKTSCLDLWWPTLFGPAG